MKITRHVHRSRSWERPNPDIDQLLAVIPASRPVNFCSPGEWAPEAAHRVVFNSMGCRLPCGTWCDSIVVNGTIWQDLSPDDTFCSELFAELTGKYPYEWCEELTPSYGDIVWG